MQNCSINKIIIFGASGMLGRYIHSYFLQKVNEFQIIAISFRITNETIDQLENILINNNIDNHTCVINCIGQIPQRKSADKGDHIYFLVNSIFPHLLWSICKKYDAKMVQPATDCVFSGEKCGGMYLETDIHDEIGSYGMSKSLGEPLGCTIIRTSIIGRELVNKKSFLEWVLSNSAEYGQNNKFINGWNNHLWNGITCLEYCKILDNIICKDLFWTGVRHLYSPTPKSKYELARMIVKTFELVDVEVNSVQASTIIDKTLASNHPLLFNIPELFDQINQLKSFELL